MNFKKIAGSNQGFSLIELSIGLLILGLFLVPAITVYNAELRERQVNDTRSAFADVRNSINTFIKMNGRYPRPASFAIAEGDPNYGSEAAFPPLPCTDVNWVIGGTCITVNANPVLIGAVPFDALGLNPDSAHDFWDNKILYAVTASQTDAGTYVRGNGWVRVRGLDTAGNQVAIITPDDTRDMVLVSHGINGRGAYSRAGVPVAPCVGGTASPENENCNFDEIFLLDKNSDLNNLGTRSYVEGPRYYDDFTQEQDSSPIDIWYQSPVTNTFAISTATRVGVGTTTPTTRLHVIGNIQADQNVISDNVCTGTGANCFNPVMIAGTQPEMDCNQNSLPNTEAVLRIANSRVYCASTVNSGGGTLDGQAFRLPSTYFTTNVICTTTGQLMAGIDTNGDPICATP